MDTDTLPALLGSPNDVARAERLRHQIFADEGVFLDRPVTTQEAEESAAELGIDPVYCGYLLRNHTRRVLYMASNLLKQDDAAWWLHNEEQARALVRMVVRDITRDTHHAMVSPLIQESPDAGCRIVQ